MKVHLKGYFGKFNLGDDLLMISSVNLIKSLFENPEILIRSHSEYINELCKGVEVIGDDVDTKNLDYLVYGGGGVFFDFQDGSSGIQNYVFGQNSSAFKLICKA